MKKALLLAVAITAANHIPAQAQAGIVRASCSEAGRIVYREDIPADAPAEKRIVIAAKHPGAMCVFLNVASAPQNAPVAGSGLPDDLIAAAAGQGSVDDAGLEAALSIITGGSPGDRYPSSIANAFTAPDRDKEKQEGTRRLSLTVGIYQDMAVLDVMEHWKLMQGGTEVLSKMTPTVNSVDGVTVISVESVPDSLAGQLCEEAAKTGPGCIAAY